VHLVDDEDLVAVPYRRDRQAGDDDLADVVDAGVAGGVDLEHVDIASLRDFDARVALAAWIRRGTLLAVERPRQDPRRRGLAAPPRAGKHKCVRDATAADRVAERTRHRLLADNLVEPLRPPLTGENLVRHGWK